MQVLLFGRCLYRGVSKITWNYFCRTTASNNKCWDSKELRQLTTIHTMDIIKSANDKRDYRIIKLENGLVSLLISNPAGPEGYECGQNEESGSESSESGEMSESDEEIMEDEDRIEDKKKPGERKSAAALCIGTGSFCDPDDIPGFAHFLEHMVFMGSEKYPKENELDDYLGKHGGYCNAWTDLERTLFYFEIQRNNFRKALDMFAHFFVSPLLLQDCVDREVEAVDSEFQMSVPDDDDRVNQIIATTTQSGHPMSKFMCGNLKTLKLIPEEKGVNIYNGLREFCKKMYSANYMTLALESKDSLDTLEEYVREIFSSIPNNNQPKPSFCHLKDPFITKDFTKFYKVSSVENIHSLDLMWAFPPLLHYYRKKPLEYLSTLITHEGKGSILSYLKQRTLALSLCGGNNYNGTENNSTCSSFTINITLTDEGLQQVNQVLSVIFEYMHLLQTSGPQKQIMDEQKIIEENKFRFKEMGEAIDYVEELSENMQMFPEEHYITGRYLLYEYDEKLLQDLTDMFKPETLNIVLRSKSFDDLGILDREEKWFTTKYTVEDIDPVWMEKWKNPELNKELFLPEENQFIATNFEILPEEASNKYPVVVLEEDGCKFWFKKDTMFNVPKGYIYLRLTSPIVFENLSNAVLCDLFINLLLQNLSESVYPAVLAGYDYSIEGFPTGIIITMNGFNHKLSLFVDTIIQHIADFSINSDLFQAVKIQLKKAYYNEMIKPYELAKMLEMAILDPNYQPLPDRYKHISSINESMLHKFIVEFTNSLFIDAFTYGNFNKQEVVDMAVLMKSKLQLSGPSIDLKPKRCYRQLSEGSVYCRVNGVNQDNCNSCVINYSQSIPGSIYHSVLNELLMSRMKEPCFDVLRTKHQLGYSVGANYRKNNGILGIQISVESQSTKFSLSTIDDHITSFLQDFQETLTSMTTDEFNSLVNSLITSKQLDEVSLEDESSRLWVEISRENYVFDRREKEISVLEKLTHQELIDWYQQYINNKQRKLSIQVEGKKDESKLNDVSEKDVVTCDNGLTFKGQGEPNKTFITEIETFKHTLMPLSYAYIHS